MVIILQYIQILNHYVLHLKLIQHYKIGGTKGTFHAHFMGTIKDDPKERQ